jgi:hypothetical protein
MAVQWIDASQAPNAISSWSGLQALNSSGFQSTRDEGQLLTWVTGPLTPGGSLDHFNEASIVFADLSCFDKGPSAFFIEAADVFLHIRDVGFEIPPDQIRVGSHVPSRRGQKRPFGRVACMGTGLRRAKSQEQSDPDQKGWVARERQVQGKPPLAALK